MGGVAGIFTTTGAVNITNFGSIASTSGSGIDAATDAIVTNNVGASITGAVAIWTHNAATVTNSGSIAGTSGPGIYASTSATVTNNAGADITGRNAGIAANNGAAAVTNSGSITGTTANGILASSSATVTNNAGASITGGAVGIETFTGAVNVTNSGSIAGTSSYGISAGSSATVTNNAGASITGGLLGIVANFGAATVANSGSITGTSNYGIFASANATVTNNAGASIAGGGYGIYAGAGGSSVFNAGSISGGTAAIRFAGTGNTLTLASGSVISGNVLGTGSDTFQLGGSGAASFDVSQLGVAAQYRGFGTFNKIGSSTWTLTGTPGQATSWTISAGTLSVSSDTNLGSGVEAFSFNGGILQVTGTAFTSTSRTINWGANGGGFDIADASNNFTVSQAIGPGGGLMKLGDGTLTLSGANTYTGGTTVDGGTLLLSGAGTLGDASGSTTVNSGGTLDLGGTTQTQSAVSLAGGTIQNGGLNASVSSTGGTISDLGGSASLTTTSGTTTLLGINSYTGATAVNGGVLDVEGSITGTSTVTVNAGGTLTGTGLVDPLVVTIASGGTLAPGNGTAGTSLAIEGNLALQSGAIYLVQVNPTAASYTTVTGNANLGGATVNAVFASGSYISKTYTILTASAGFSGTFGSLVDTNLPANFSTNLSYDANNAYLNLVLNFAIPGGLNGNQQAVGNALTNFFNANGSIPLTYGALTAAGLTQASGELGTSPQQTTFNAMGQFMGLLTDPVAQRSGEAGSGSGAAAFADEDSASAYAARKPTDAFAMVTKAPPRTFEQRWSVWAAGFGGSQATSGNAIVGSNDTTSRIFGTAAGADYRVSADTLAGFALAGGGTNFSVAGGLGSGRSDLFQAGAYLRHTNGPAYIAAALAYGWQDITTDRTVTITGADRLRAEFKANAWSGRVEGGYRFVVPWIGGIGLIPYGAAQFVTFDLPAYAEQVVSGSSAFALSYATKTVTDTRSELGLRSDKSFALPAGVLTLRGRAAWAHDFNPDRSIAATFQALPGASFVVNGAAQARDSALTTASIEMKWLSGWSAATTFEGEFSNVTRSYAGKGVVRYVW
ncbi:autotransporter domain-containing protein [Bradyrhizobium sp. CNPSo 4010]|uniref:Autotransporter domain-containing protein n=2 Tax=Bradyrhizobium agreste TaxID=2751811 RepID=A0ABS0PPT2_9BRAD|nr:autotransporter domain-containing protein [Bradyrhizobium agreste]